jgi:hypothetical protein
MIRGEKEVHAGHGHIELAGRMLEMAMNAPIDDAITATANVLGTLTASMIRYGHAKPGTSLEDLMTVFACLGYRPGGSRPSSLPSSAPKSWLHPGRQLLDDPDLRHFARHPEASIWASIPPSTGAGVMEMHLRQFVSGPPVQKRNRVSKNEASGAGQVVVEEHFAIVIQPD